MVRLSSGRRGRDRTRSRSYQPEIRSGLRSELKRQPVSEIREQYQAIVKRADTEPVLFELTQKGVDLPGESIPVCG